MSFSITLFGPSHFWWKGSEIYPRLWPKAWFHRPDAYSTGGVGFCLPGLHVVFCWGRHRPTHRRNRR